MKHTYNVLIVVKWGILHQSVPRKMEAQSEAQLQYQMHRKFSQQGRPRFQKKNQDQELDLCGQG